MGIEIIVNIPKNRIRYFINLKYKVIPTPSLSNTLKCDELKQLFF